MEPRGTVGSSTVNLVKTIVGAGLLAIPFVFRNDGVFVGILLVLVAAVTSGFGLFALAKCSKTMINPRNSSFFTFCMMANPSLSFVSDFAMIIQCFGVGISYLVLIGDLFPSIFGGSRHLWIMASSIAIIPICLLKNLNSLKFTSILGLFALGYLICLVVVRFFASYTGYNHGDARGEIYWFKIYDYSGLIKTFSIVIFAFTGSMNLFSIINELKDNSMTSITKVINNSIGISSLIFLTVGICGYLTFGSDTEGNIILNYDPESIWINIAKFCLGSMVTLSFPLLFHPLRISVNNIIIYYKMLNDKKEAVCEVSEISSSRPILLSVTDSENPSLMEPTVENPEAATDEENENEDFDCETGASALYETPFPNTRFYLITFGLLASMYGVSMVIESFAFVLALVGATGSTSISFILPGIFGYKLIGADSLAIGEMISRQDRFYRKCSISLVIYGFLVMFMSLYLLCTDRSGNDAVV